MTDTVRTKKIELGRSLLVGCLLFATMFTCRLYLAPLHPALEGPLPAGLMAGVMAVGAWWLVFRRWGGEPDGGDSLERGRRDRTVRTSLLAGAVVLVLFPVFRFGVLPFFPQVDGVLAAVLAAGAAGAVAPWLIRLGRGS